MTNLHVIFIIDISFTRAYSYEVHKLILNSVLISQLTIIHCIISQYL